MGAVAVILILLIVIAVILAVLGVFIWMIFLVYRAGVAVPAEHQRMDPGLVWLMVIPVFQTIWAFFVASRICGGLSAAFEARGLDRETAVDSRGWPTPSPWCFSWCFPSSGADCNSSVRSECQTCQRVPSRRPSTLG